jgi:hypothetical protein
MDELRYIWFPIWVAALWPAYVFRPEWLRTAGQSGPFLKRLGVSLLGMIFCFGIASLVAVAAVVIVALVIGFGLGVGV